MDTTQNPVQVQELPTESEGLSRREALSSGEELSRPEVHYEGMARPGDLSRLEGLSRPAAQATWALGARPPLLISDLPTPEEAFGHRHLGLEERLLLAIGPGVIALGVSIGSGEWILGPLNVARFGFRGIFWVVLISIILQVLYNMELGRYTLATGESPILGFARIPPGPWVWIPLALVCFYMAFILGGWTISAGQSLLALIVGRPLTPADDLFARQVGVLLLISIFGLLLIGRKIERSMEMVQGAFLPYILIGLLMVSIVIVPAEYWSMAVAGLLIPTRPPAGTDVSLWGALTGFAALASGLNWMYFAYYRDKGYGMGHRVGYLSGLIGGQANTLQPQGQTFAETEANSLLWKRWWRMLAFDQWGIYFFGALLGIFLPSLLGGYLISSSGVDPNTLDSVTLIATALSNRYGQLLGGWALILGFVILYSTQIVILELLARNLTESIYCNSERVRQASGNDPRMLYYPALVLIIVAIAFIISIRPAQTLTVLSGNISNLAAMIFPLALIYLNRRLPRPARMTWWSYIGLIANAIFFGFFFINFLVLQLTGSALIGF